MPSYKCSAKRGLTVDEKATWDGDAAKAAIFKWAGWPNNPDGNKASGAFLAWDSSKPTVQGSFKLPFATVSGGSLKAIRAGLNNAASRLSNTDIPEGVKSSAQDVIDSYKKSEKMDDVEERYDTEMGYSDSMTLDLRLGDSEPNLLALAKKRALDPTVFDEHPPFFFSGIISNDKWDSYNTRMGNTSLANYAADADAGVPYLRSHNKSGDPVGGTLTGTMDGKKVRADVYMIGDPDSAVYIAKIRAGIVKDQSIGFTGGEYMCSICNKDMRNWRVSDPCPHFLGMSYPVTDKKGKVLADRGDVLARATIENAHLGETSGVYSGSTPGAFIDKARAFSDAGQMEQGTLDFVQVRYGIKLPAQRHVYPVAKREAKMTEEEIQALRDAEATAQKRVKALEALVASAKAPIASVIPADRAESPLADQVSWLADERARLLPLAADGAAYRTALTEEALAEGARAHGTDFQREIYLDMLGRAPITTIRQMRDDWNKAADKIFPKGRQTQDGESPKAETKTDDRIKTRNDFAFKG